ncbi:PREDICTED: ionotropic receptor 25a [Nicrophorus vespilloides]|uniref:Ionotropic receptor 25a n=1 Tax=Nicrophorus vespilloides TaxID=110193 RepID=A0ABM1N5P0_NICVS|nr:PREDICTED: ionotropic receptor 25a [Nicrophorus vespilloides]
MGSKTSTWILIIISLMKIVCGQDKFIKFILIKDLGQEEYTQYIEDSLKSNNVDNKYDLIVLTLDENAAFEQLCSGFSQGGTIILDISITGYEVIKDIADEMNVPYVKLDLSISPILRLLDKYLDARNSTDVALVFEDPKDVDQALYYWIDTTRLRMVITEQLDPISAKRLRDMRPSPNNLALLASSENMMTLYNQLEKENLLKLAERWNLVITDFQRDRLVNKFIPFINLISLDKSMCCGLIKTHNCACKSFNDAVKNLVTVTIQLLSTVLNRMSKTDLEISISCNETLYDRDVRGRIERSLNQLIMDEEFINYDQSVIGMRTKGFIEIVDSNSIPVVVAKYLEGDSLEILIEDKIKQVKPFYRIGTTYAMPWSFPEIDPETGLERWTGYCLDFAKKLSEVMNFDYEIVIPKKGTFGEKDEFGNWNGVIGDIVRGETDMAIAALTMTADREEVVDFIAPYFEQVGITIVMRKPVRKTSLFKFMTVLKLEVWLSIVGALVVTGFMVWFLDKYSPYSSRNNKAAYPYPCRQFNLKESFWFALTSFTPQGGGEAPKALSGRTLVASYWLFVVLMLATFTANLAAFLTVERMQTPVQSLEQLARQSRINYTVVESSETHKYFINMKFAEDTLYRLWKELTLNASTDDTRYRVWDYPIREMYGQILISINDSMPLPTAKAGFDKVDELLEADFAFIHDSSEIKYEISRNCNFTEVGEVFAEKPYAIAIQQGGHLQDAISIVMLDLQRERFFESLQAKYWNHSVKGECDNADDNEGITLQSLGGVFIATLFGLALAMITLAGEVFYYRHKKSQDEVKKLTKVEKKQDPEKPESNKFIKTMPDGGTITIGESFKPTTMEKMRVSHIALYPRTRGRLPNVDA